MILDPNYSTLEELYAVSSLLWLNIHWCQSLSIFFRIPSLALGQSYDRPSANEGTLKNIDEKDEMH